MERRAKGKIHTNNDEPFTQFLQLPDDVYDHTEGDCAQRDTDGQSNEALVRTASAHQITISKVSVAAQQRERKV